MRIEDFDYDLPPAAIAQEPLPERDQSRLLVLERSSGRLEHRTFRELPTLLAAGDLIVVNRSRVRQARLLGQRPGGGRAEVLLVERLESGEWEALVRPARRLRPGDRVSISAAVAVQVVSGPLGVDGRRRVRIEAAEPDAERVLEQLGHTPLPPYIRRAAHAGDRERYQTLYAREPGSVAAPTAGLHFSHAVLADLAQRGIDRAELVLHVGPGTFQPVRAREVENHRVEAEPFAVEPAVCAAVTRARARGGRVVAAGTTTVRALETAATADGTPGVRSGRTDLVIAPGYRFRVVDALVTNFHLPRSSLLLLVAAFAGREQVLGAYREAIRSGYRFYSYGDAMLIL